jgi:hypothetical protein
MCKIILSAGAMGFLLCGLAKADDQANAIVILDEGIKAQGGEATLSKFTANHTKFKGAWYGGGTKSPLHCESFADGSDKGRTVTLSEDNKMSQVEVINGTDGWTKDGDQDTKKLSGKQLDSRREFQYVIWATTLVPLKAREFHLSVLDETDVGGRRAVPILVKHPKHDPLKLYFDKQTRLFVKYQRRFKNPTDGKEYDEECVVSDYRTVQETRQAFKFEIFWDKAKVADFVATDIRLYDTPLDEKLFEKP